MMWSLHFQLLLFSIIICLGKSIESSEHAHYHEAFSSELLAKHDSLIRDLEKKLNVLDYMVKSKSDELEELQLMFYEMDAATKGKSETSKWPPTTAHPTTARPTTAGPTTAKTITLVPTTVIRTTTQKPETTTTPDKSVEERLQHLEELSKIHTLRSCNEYDEYGINTSGTYFIDPDGPLVGIEPFEVHCNFDDHSTEILHDHDGQTVEIDHCTEPHVCFHLELKYPTKMEQMVSLIDLSDTCIQEITFNCFLAPLSVNGEAIGTWVNRNGGNETYFTGSNHGTHICDCGVKKECSDTEHSNVCNCDAAELPIGQVDSGVITDMSALPIIGFNYGDLLEYPDQNAQIYIGRLKCKGKKKLLPEDINDSCKNLKLDGESRSRNYALNDGSLAFCDMTKRITDDAIERKIGDFQFKEPMFEAFVDKPHKDENGTNIGYHIPTGTIKYDRTALDEGNCMDPTTGIFSAPKDGIYLFGIDGHKCSGNAKAQIVVYHNGKEAKSIDHSDKEAQSTQITSFWTLEMKVADTVYLVNNMKSSLYTLGDNPSTYSFSFVSFYLS